MSIDNEHLYRAFVSIVIHYKLLHGILLFYVKAYKIILLKIFMWK